MNKQTEPTTDNLSARVTQLRQAGLRATAARLAILDALERDARHPTAEMLHDALRAQHPSISLSTVYAALETFLQRGLLRRISTQSGKLRVDGTVQDHDHAICRSCSAVFDIERDLIQRPTAPALLPSGLRVLNLHIEYEVVCPACSESRAVRQTKETASLHSFGSQ